MSTSPNLLLLAAAGACLILLGWFRRRNLGMDS